MADETYHPDAIHHPPSANLNEGDVLNGTGAPSAGAGKNGDLYIDLSTGITYQKTNGVWSAIGGGVKVWRALVTQIGTGIPTAVVLENTLGTNVVISRDDTGTYEFVPSVNAEFPNGFPIGKTMFWISNYDYVAIAGIHLLGTGEVEVITAGDDALQGNSMEILVYP